MRFINPREYTEEMEYKNLSLFASKSACTKGRMNPAPKCDLRTEYQKDRDRIIHSKAFRRLVNKTQVFISPEGDHYRTRLTHTLEVSQIARSISRSLRLNEDLTEAIALGHDLGHTPFGHTGEDALDKLSLSGFRHNEQSLRVVDVLENGGKGINLTFEVRDGIVNHRSAGIPSTLEGKVVQLSDKIAYINHDIDDAIRAGLLTPTDLPHECIRILGSSCSERINTLIHNIVKTSQDQNEIMLEEEVKNALSELRLFLFGAVYSNQLHKAERNKIHHMLSELFNYFLVNSNKLPVELFQMITEGEKRDRVVCDYIAGMTDRFALKMFSEIFIPTAWNL